MTVKGNLKIAEMISWPAFIKVSNDSHLAYLDSVECWGAMIDDEYYQAGDLLIDSTGKQYSLLALVDYAKSQESMPKYESCSLAEAVLYAQEYALVANTCCSSKVGADSFVNLMAVIKSIDT